MPRKLIVSALFFAFVCPTFAAPVPKQLKKRTDAERMLGEWKTTFAEYNSGPYNGAQDYLIFTEGLLNWKSSETAPDVLWTIILEPNADPKEFEIAQIANRAKCLGIYKFEGDELTLACRTGSRPTEFTSAGNTYLHKLTRVK